LAKTITNANTGYNLWLVKAHSENPIGFSSDLPARLVAQTQPAAGRHAAARAETVVVHCPNTTKKKMKTKFLILLIILINIACSDQEKEIEEELQNCVNQQLKDLRPESTNFYGLMIEMEKRMIEKGILKNNNRKDYQDLFDSMASGSERIEEFYIKNIEYLDQNFPFYLFLANDIIFNQCPYKVSSQSKELQIYKQGELQNRVMESGFNDLELNKRLIGNLEESDFQKNVYRAPIIYLILINMDLKYDHDQQNLKVFKKGRQFLNTN
jgi:hypothetical protein